MSKQVYLVPKLGQGKENAIIKHNQKEIINEKKEIKNSLKMYLLSLIIFLSGFTLFSTIGIFSLLFFIYEITHLSLIYLKKKTMLVL